MEYEHKSASFELKAAPGEDGTFEGYASVFGALDKGMDVVERGAFAESLASDRRIKMLWQHDHKKVIGVWEQIKEDERGLYVKGRLLTDVHLGKEALALLRAGAIDSMSIGYKSKEVIRDGNGSVRRLTKVDLYEISLVTFPMLPEAKVMDVKSIATERDFEQFLRDAGYSRNEAKAITAYGFKAIRTQRDADGADAAIEGINSLINQLTQLKETINA